MPTALRVGPYRFFFYSGDGSGPAHMDVESGDSEAEFWLEPVELAVDRGFPPKEVRKIKALVETHRDELLEKWREHFG